MANQQEAGVVREKKQHKSMGFMLLLGGAVLMGAGLAPPIFLLTRGIAELAGIVVLIAGVYRLWKGFIVTERDVLRLCDQRDTDVMQLTTHDIIKEFGCSRKDAEVLIKRLRASAYEDMSDDELVQFANDETENLDQLIKRHSDVVGDSAKADQAESE